MFLLLGFFFIYLFLYDFFFFKQKTAYEIKECDWSSDVCSSDLAPAKPSVGAPGRCGSCRQGQIPPTNAHF